METWKYHHFQAGHRDTHDNQAQEDVPRRPVPRRGCCQPTTDPQRSDGDPSIAFSCRYRGEATGEWKGSSSMQPNAAARAVLVLQEALELCWLCEGVSRHGSGPDEWTLLWSGH